jgi:putative acetyltransferase
MLIRNENVKDYEAVYKLNASTFESEAEAKLVDRLRELGEAAVSLVAESSSEVVGHILFSEVTLSEHASLKIVGLAPMAVAPKCQRNGTGSALIKAGLEACRVKGYVAVVVLGHSTYYPKFGFRPSTEFGFKSEYDVPSEVFMALELQQNSLSEVSGVISYHPSFAAV